MKNLSALMVPDGERRIAPRHNSKDKALGLVRGRRDGVPCTVMDISETGARVRLDGARGFVPKEFKLYIEEKSLLVACEQVWRKGNQAGLRFTSVVDFSRA